MHPLCSRLPPQWTVGLPDGQSSRAFVSSPDSTQSQQRAPSATFSDLGVCASAYPGLQRWRMAVGSRLRPARANLRDRERCTRDGDRRQYRGPRECIRNGGGCLLFGLRIADPKDRRINNSAFGERLCDARTLACGPEGVARSRYCNRGRMASLEMRPSKIASTCLR